MEYNETDLKNKVIEEAKNLLIHATKEERDLLEFRFLDFEHPMMCVYGQMAGGCYSDRATDLLKLCAIPYSDGMSKDGFNPSKAKAFPPGNIRAYSAIFSPIEFYISTQTAKNDVLIDFLRGERETLTVEDL